MNIREVEKTAILCFLYELKKMGYYPYVLKKFKGTFFSNIIYSNTKLIKSFMYRMYQSNRDGDVIEEDNLVNCNSLKDIENFFTKQFSNNRKEKLSKEESIEMSTRIINHLLHTFLETAVGFPKICQVGQDIFDHTMLCLGIEVPKENDIDIGDKEQLLNKVMHKYALTNNRMSYNEFIKAKKRISDNYMEIDDINELMNLLSMDKVSRNISTATNSFDSLQPLSVTVNGIF